MDKQLKRRHDCSVITIFFGVFALIFWTNGHSFQNIRANAIKYQEKYGEPSKYNVPEDVLFLHYDPQLFLYSGIALIVIGAAFLVHTNSLVKKAHLVSESDQ